MPHRQCGKLVVATDESEDAYLGRLAQRAKENGVEDIARIGAARLKALEPCLRGTSALLSPCSGIVDSHALMLSYQADAEAAGATIAFRTPVLAAAMTGGKIGLRTGGTETADIEADLVVNAAGLAAWDFSTRLAGLELTTIPPRYLAKGNYFTLSGTAAPFRHLIYPVPEPGGLGTHLTFDLAGQARFGPDVEWIDTIDYAVDPARGRKFYAAIRRYWPDLPDDALVPAYAGIRPKTAVTGESDFVIQGPGETGHRGYVALYRDRVAGAHGVTRDRRARGRIVRASMIFGKLSGYPNGLPPRRAQAYRGAGLLTLDGGTRHNQLLAAGRRAVRQRKRPQEFDLRGRSRVRHLRPTSRRHP